MGGRRRYEQFLAQVGQQNVFALMAEGGLTPEQIRDAAVEQLEPYFENREALVRQVIDVLLPDAITVARLEATGWGAEMLARCLETHRAAKSVAPTESFEAVRSWLLPTVQGLSDFWSQYHLQHDLDELEIEEFVHECKQLIGTTIEGVMKPQLKLLLHQLRLSRRRPVTAAQLDALRLGSVVDELATHSGYPELFAPPPWGLRLHDWRNVAQHHATAVEGREIVCRYGPPDNPKEISLCRDELSTLVRFLSMIQTILATASAIYHLDNIDEIRALGPPPAGLTVRPESELLHFQVALGSQGFELVHADWGATEATAVVRDLREGDPLSRAVHASQFVVTLWVHTRAERVTVEYRERDGTPYLRARALAHDCERVARGQIPFAELADLVEMSSLRTGRLVGPRFEEREATK